MTQFKLFNIQISEEKERQYERVCLSASVYMEKLVSSIGRRARKPGEYFAPGENTHNDGEWLPELSAMAYIHKTVKQLRLLAEDGKIRRREYVRSGKRIFYEYSVEDLNTLVKIV